MRKNVVLIPLLLLLSCIDNTEVLQPKPEPGLHVIKPDEHPQLMQAFQKLVVPTLANGRTHAALGEIYTDEALMRVSDDLQTTNYSFEIESEPYELKNLVVHETENGFSVFVLHYLPDAEWLIANPDLPWDSFTGALLIKTIDGDIIEERKLANGQIAGTSDAKVQDYCLITTWRIVKMSPYGISVYYETDIECFATEKPAGGIGGGAGGNGGSSGGDGGTSNGAPAKPKSSGKIGITDKKKKEKETCDINCILNYLKNPCLKLVADKALDPSLNSTLNNLIQDIFNSNEKVNLILKEGNLKNALGLTGNVITDPNGNLNITITLDPNEFVNSSQEFIAAAIYHECFHAIIKYLTSEVSSNDQHIAMYTQYLDLLSTALHKAYPSMQYGDGKGLILNGLINLDGGDTPKTDYWSTEFVNSILEQSNFTRSQISKIVNRYEIYKTSGTLCP